MTSLFRFNVHYTDPSGQTVTERIASLPWSRSVRVTPPFDARLRVGFEARADYPQKTLYDVGFDGRIDGSSASSATMRSASAAQADDAQVLRLRFDYPDEAMAGRAELRVAPLKYDKHFVFTLTVDDAWTNAYSLLWNRIHGKWIDDEPFHHLGRPRTTGYTPDGVLAMTDGCGNERRFGFSCAIWPTWGNDLNETFVKDLAETRDKSIYIAWEELGLMADFGVSLLLHNVDERVWDNTDPARIADGLRKDVEKTCDKLGIRMKVLGLPDGRQSYLDAAALWEGVAFVRNSLARTKIYLKECGDLYKKETYGGERSQEVADKLSELAAQAAAENPFWVAMTIHRPYPEHAEMLETVCRLYGKQGSDELWVASWDEVYEYVALREGVRIGRSVEGCTATFTVTLPAYGEYLFPELSFLADGALSAEALSDNIMGMSCAPHGEALLANVAFGGRWVRLAEKYVDIYETEPTDETLADARYFVGRLLPALAEPFERRMGQVVRPGENQVTAKGAVQYRSRWNGYELTVSRRIGK